MAAASRGEATKGVEAGRREASRRLALVEMAQSAARLSQEPGL
jgi:hypothetical protein